MSRKFLVMVDDNEEDVFYVSTEIESTDREMITEEAYDSIAGYLEKTGVSYTYFDIIDVTEVSEVEL
jgi:ribosomal protein L20A (L18A)